MMRPGETSTVIGRSTKLRGELSCADDLQIEGEFEGAIRLTSGRITIGADARVLANISAPEVLIYGRLEGDIRATGRVDLRANAVVIGDVFAGRLSMEESAMLRGRVDPSRAGEQEAAAMTESKPRIVATAPVAMAVPAVAPVESEMIYGEPVSSPQREYLPVRKEQTVPSTLTQSGRQLPAALAAFAPGGRQDSGVYRNDGLRADEDAPWRTRGSED